MKIIILILILSLTGCSSIYNLDDFVTPNDIEFINTIEKLNTPEIICDYMRNNFTYKENPYHSTDPYQTWLDRTGDCNDYATFAIFVAHWHGYEVYQMHIYLKNLKDTHYLAIYVEDGYSYSSLESYFPLQFNTFLEIADRRTWSKYIVYDYEMNVVEISHRNLSVH